MTNVKVYEIAQSATPNAKKLLFPDQGFFYWNDKKFKQMSSGEKVYFINKSDMYSLFTEIDITDIQATIDSDKSSFEDAGQQIKVDREFERFIRFKIIEKKEIPQSWRWTTLGAAEATNLRSNGEQGQSIKENNIQRINQLLEIYTDPLTESHILLNDCKNRLQQLIATTEGTEVKATNGDLMTIQNYCKAKGFIFEPWQIATYITALRTKPFVILAGVSGTGKSKLPALVAEATGGKAELIPVRPDWTDSSDILGYCDLQGNFRPGRLLEIIKDAYANNDKHYVCIIDEMNLARVEHYFAEVLSRIEDRREVEGGGFKSGPLVSQKLSENDAEWAQYGLPPNLAIVGTVNMDESSHGFSRKVLDRAFTVELSDIDLGKWEAGNMQPAGKINWPLNNWYPRAIQLGKLEKYSDEERQTTEEIIARLKDINNILVHAQLQIGYRTRDEIVMFVLHAKELSSSFKTHGGNNVDPFDLALQMKILPRIVGGSSPVRRVVYELLGWTTNKGQLYQNEEDAQSLLNKWDTSGRPSRINDDVKYPFTAARLCLMLDRIKNEGFTSFWL
ncbi:MAG: AAA family ATPase [bacterium]